MLILLELKPPEAFRGPARTTGSSARFHSFTALGAERSQNVRARERGLTASTRGQATEQRTPRRCAAARHTSAAELFVVEEKKLNSFAFRLLLWICTAGSHLLNDLLPKH